MTTPALSAPADRQPAWLRRLFDQMRDDCRARPASECDGPWTIAYAGTSSPAGATCKRCGARWTVEGEAVRRVHEPRPAPERSPKTEEVG